MVFKNLVCLLLAARLFSCDKKDNAKKIIRLAEER